LDCRSPALVRSTRRSRGKRNYYACSPGSIVLPDVVPPFRAGRLSLMGNGMYRHVPPAGDRTANIFFAKRALRRGARLMLCGQLASLHHGSTSPPQDAANATIKIFSSFGPRRRTSPKNKPARARDREPISDTRKIESAGFAAKSQILPGGRPTFLSHLGVSRAITREDRSIYIS
jgi:hypothetical protein